MAEWMQDFEENGHQLRSQCYCAICWIYRQLRRVFQNLPWVCLHKSLFRIHTLQLVCTGQVLTTSASTEPIKTNEVQQTQYRKYLCEWEGDRCRLDSRSMSLNIWGLLSKTMHSAQERCRRERVEPVKTRFRDDSSKSLQDGTVSLEMVVLTKRQGAKLQVAELKMLEISTSVLKVHNSKYSSAICG